MSGSGPAADPADPAREAASVDAAPGQACCGLCGATAQDPPLSWSVQVSERGTGWLCEPCTRQNLRSIESRLDEAWW